MQRARETLGRYARWILLACTLLGVAAMHTLGHIDGGHGHGTPSAGTVVMADVAADCAGDGCLGGHHRDEHMPMSWSVCLAVVAGLAVATLLLWSIAARGRSASRPVDAPRIPWHSRGPPLPGAGLVLATTSVLRT
ncbi:hypothetical protein Val02_65090 [Virgisporangium aliadipatigenens]|uniref:Uncharacterized protein n=1 Tax=Virgisporangium aliadipatigenens TaxID=741659 RepID=A0A8J3YSI3_9ACTN|nr:DUF6153 family protein [Virgisporangium aliadipatigenens]GIJ49623.1 hypothetical protein Val02_65090 [Virgisporangium aliadipatigenens]